MLVGTNLYLANCDSVHKRPLDEVRARVVWGLAFAERIILTPNIVIDNPSTEEIFSSHTVYKFLTENPGKIIIRHNHSQPELCFRDYFNELDDEFVVSSHNGSPRKRDLKPDRLGTIHKRLDKLDALFSAFKATHENVQLSPNSLSTQIGSVLDNLTSEPIENPSMEPADLEKLRSADNLHSRSAWYGYLESHFEGNALKREKIRSEIVDPAYNGLFIRSAEAFASDRLRPGMLYIPEVVLMKHAYKDEVDAVKRLLKIIRFVHTLGADGAVGWLVEMTSDHLKEYLADHANKFITARRTWKNMHDQMLNHVGVGIKQ